MIGKVAFIPMCFLAATANAALPAQFDLVCKGHSYMASWEAVDYGEITTTLRFDIGAAKYCAAECREIKDVAKISPDKIVLYDTMQDGVFSQQYFDTSAGKLITRSGIQGPPPKGWVASNESACEVTKFSGFPKLSPGEKG